MQKRKIVGVAVVVALSAALVYDMVFNFVDWRTADRSSAGIAPAASQVSEAVVQVYAARTYNWRGYFAVHSWIAVKPKDAKDYTTYQVMGFYLRRNGTAVVIQQDLPDRRWYGAEPELLGELRGEAAEKAIPKIDAAAKSYPYAHMYQAYPGPNSNTFISYILRQVPELKTDLPPHAIGKDFIGYKQFIAPTESGTGYQFSLWGIFGIALGIEEGIEINVLGLNFGIDFVNPALKLPFVGRLGMDKL